VICVERTSKVCIHGMANTRTSFVMTGKGHCVEFAEILMYIHEKIHSVESFCRNVMWYFALFSLRKEIRLLVSKCLNGYLKCC
jgi:hypothetical protein